MWTVEIIGAIDEQAHYDPHDIIKLLANDSQALLIDSDFVGRPVTRIYANSQHVLKIRSEFNFIAKQARLWTLKTLRKEQQLAVHHPHKTWLVITQNCLEANSEGYSLCASICPRLKPLHSELKSAPLSADSKQHYINLLDAVFSLYLNLAKRTNYKLDEGLSNFGLSVEGNVYYLDDEYYLWDKFVSFAVMLGVYIRSFDWLDAAFIDELAALLRQRLDSIFADDHCHLIVARQLQAVFMPQGQKEQLLHLLIANLLQVPSPLTTDTPLINQRLIQTFPQPHNSRFFALLADVHANYAALEATLDYLETQGISEGIVLGDIVGYGPEPRECIERLANSSLQIIKGNHDHAVAVGKAALGFSSLSRSVIDWTVAQLSASERQWLNELPVFIENEAWFAVHGSPMDPEFFYGYVYMMTYEDNLAYMAAHTMPLCFHGHSHIPGVFARDKHHRDVALTQKDIALSGYSHALVCPGSVGQPRNGQAQAQFAIYDTKLREVRFMSIAYSVEKAVQKMRTAGFSEELVHRLQVGR